VTTGKIAANAVTDAKLRQGGQFTVIGRSAVTSGDVADIQAVGNGDVLRVASNVLGFGHIPQTSVDNLTTDLTLKVPTTRQIIAGAGMTGGGDLSADRTLSLTNVGPGAGHYGGTGIESITLDVNGRVTALTVDDFLDGVLGTAGQITATTGTQAPVVGLANFGSPGTYGHLSSGATLVLGLVHRERRQHDGG
jgi:hypothetical protein